MQIVVGGKELRQVTVLYRWGQVVRQLSPGEKIRLGEGEKVEGYSTSWHDIDFGPFPSWLKTGTEVLLAGTLSFRVLPDKAAEFARISPYEMPSYPNESLRDWLVVRLKRVIHQAIAQKELGEELRSSQFLQSLADEFKRKLNETIEAEITIWLALVGKPEDLERALKDLQTAYQALRTLQEGRS